MCVGELSIHFSQDAIINHSNNPRENFIYGYECYHGRNYENHDNPGEYDHKHSYPQHCHPIQSSIIIIDCWTPPQQNERECYPRRYDYYNKICNQKYYITYTHLCYQKDSTMNKYTVSRTTISSQTPPNPKNNPINLRINHE